jgi:hypothetical protein
MFTGKIAAKFTTLAVAAVTVTALAMPTVASAERAPGYDSYNASYAVPVAGALVGTAVGVGLYNGWYGSSTFVSALPSSAAGAVAMGGVAGIGTVALIDGVLQPCRGFHALFGANKDACVNGEYVGYAQRPARYVR